MSEVVGEEHSSQLERHDRVNRYVIELHLRLPKTEHHSPDHSLVFLKHAVTRDEVGVAREVEHPQVEHLEVSEPWNPLYPFVADHRVTEVHRRRGELEPCRLAAGVITEEGGVQDDELRVVQTHDPVMTCVLHHSRVRYLRVLVLPTRQFLQERVNKRPHYLRPVVVDVTQLYAVSTCLGGVEHTPAILSQTVGS